MPLESPSLAGGTETETSSNVPPFRLQGSAPTQQARNSSTSAEVLTALARENNSDVRWGVATNSSMPAEVLAALARENDRVMRQGVARAS